MDQKDLKEQLVGLLRDLLKSEPDSRVRIIENAIRFLSLVPDTKKVVEKLEKLKKRIETYVASTVDLMEIIKEEFPDLYTEVLSDSELITLLVVSKIQVKYYAGGKILVVIPINENKFHEFEFKRKDVSKYTTSRFSDNPKFLIDPVTLGSIFEEYGYKGDITESMVKEFNDHLVSLITVAYKNPLPFHDEKEEEAFEEFKVDLAHYEYIFKYEDKEKVIGLLGIDPNYIVFVDKKNVYIPSKLINQYIRARRFPNLIKKFTKATIKRFYTSYIVDKRKYNVYYFIVPKKELTSILGIPIEPKDIQTTIDLESSEVLEVLEELSPKKDKESKEE